jgi:hypothetical protein
MMTPASVLMKSVADRVILDSPECSGINLSRLEICARRVQRSRAQQAADGVGAEIWSLRDHDNVLG